MGEGNKVEFLVAICALVTSMVAVFIGWDQGRVMRAQQHGAVYPVLQLEGFVSTQNEQRQLGIRIANNGVGPALVEGVRLRSIGDGSEIETLRPFIAGLPQGADISWAGLAGRAIAPGERLSPITVAWPQDSVTDSDIGRAVAITADWQLEVCYCSVFQRCWITSEIGVARSERVDACFSTETDVFTAFGESVMMPPPEPATDAIEDETPQ